MQAFNRYRSEVTGAQASFQEIQFLLNSMPTQFDRDPATIFAKANAVIESVDAAFNTTLDSLSRNAFNVVPFTGQGESPDLSINAKRTSPSLEPEVGTRKKDSEGNLREFVGGEDIGANWRLVQ